LQQELRDYLVRRRKLLRALKKKSNIHLRKK
jgi:hypothetical protein